MGASWNFSRPAWQPQRWSVGGSIYVGPRYSYYPRPYYSYYPTYVPSYYEGYSYYPVQPAYYTAPGVTYVAPIRQPLPRLGIGLFGGGSDVGTQSDGSSIQSSDIGLLGRLRLTPGLVVEGELGKMSYDVNGASNLRVDRRLGASLLYEIGAYNAWAPYILVGTGVQQADVAGTYSTTQDYGEVGIGLRWALSRQFHLAFDIRTGSRSTVSSSDTMTSAPTGTVARTITPPPASSNDTEQYTRARLAAILYF